MIGQQHFVLKDGTPLLVREVTYYDASWLNQLARAIFGSTDQVLTLPEEFESSSSLAAQTKRIEHYLQQEGKCILVAEANGKLIGTLDFWNGNKQKIAHTGEFGMGVHLDFRNKGVGKCLLTVLLDWARQSTLIEKVKLGVFASNTTAIHLYQSMGFVEEGRSVAEVKTVEGDYIDIIEMYQKV